MIKIKGISKFNYCEFIGGTDCFAVNSQTHSEKEAIEIFIGEYQLEKDAKFKITKAFVKWRIGFDEDGNKYIGWWLEYRAREKGSCPVYAFSLYTK